jgi:hypothetical protein
MRCVLDKIAETHSLHATSHAIEPC